MPRRTRPLKGTSADQRVGRGNPPKHAQFQKGTTGNPKGRPKGSRNLASILAEAARGQVVATIGGKLRKISRLQATAMQLATKAAGGDHASIGKLLDWVDEIETRAAAARPVQFPFSAADLEVVKAIFERVKPCGPDGTEA